ncbi:MAG: hypothetical protein ABFS16_08710 [Bacteroidota bacterium]
MKIIVKVFIVLLLAGFMACEKQDSEIGAIDLDIKAYNGESGLIVLKSGTVMDTLGIDSAVIILEKIEIKLQDELEEDDMDDEESEENKQEEENEYYLEGPYVIDLLAATNEPEFPVVVTTPGIYTKFEAELYVPEDLGYSLYISGTCTMEGSGEQKFIYTYSQTEDFKAENPDGFEIADDMITQVMVMVNMEHLFEGVDFSQAIVDGDDIVRINKDSNNDLADIIEENLENASEIDTD